MVCFSLVEFDVQLTFRALALFKIVGNYFI